MPTDTRYELQTQDGIPITAQYDQILGAAQLDEEQNITPTQDGYELEWEGSTNIIWDAQEPEYRYGEVLYQDENGNTRLGGDLVIVELAEGEDGDERVISTRPYTDCARLPLTEPPTAALDRVNEALELAQWVIGAQKAVTQGGSLTRISEEARDRIHARARHYARTAEVEDIFNGLLDAALIALPVE